MREFLTKDISGGMLDMDASTRRVKFAFAQMGSVDLDNDMFDSNAFTKSIAERGPNGSNEIFHLMDHVSRLNSMLGKMKEVYVEGQYLVGVSEYKDSFAWREVAWPAYEAGDITQHSIGFSIINRTLDKNYRIITEAKVWEGSAVLWGANPNTPTIEVAKTLGIVHDEELPQRIEKMTRAIKEDKYNEEVKSLLIIELTQIYSELKQAKTIEPDAQSIQPEVNKDAEMMLLLSLNQFKNKLKLI